MEPTHDEINERSNDDDVEDLEACGGESAAVSGGAMIKSVEISNLKAGDSS